MFKSKKFIIGLVGAVVLASIMLVGVTGFGLYRYVSAAVTPTPVPGTNTPNVMSQYWSLFLGSFAKNLGVDQGKLDSAFVAAINTTLDQAVKDGKLTQAQADSVKSRYSNGLSGMQNGFGFNFGFGRGFGGMGRRGGEQLITTADIANALGIKEADLLTALQSGKTIADVAKTQNKDLAAVKSTLLAGAKTKLDTQVAAKTLTQAQADQLYTNLTNSIDALLNNTNSRMGGFGPGMPGGFGMPGMQGIANLASADIASTLGISESDLNTQLMAGKSIADIAKAQNKDLATVKSTLLADAKTKLDAAVTAKTLTQAQADGIYQKLTTSIDGILNNTMPFRGGPGFFGRPGGRQKTNPTPAPGNGA